ncbi:MAG: DUF4149 domain-containing protein [Polyangiaceae bacterium]
MSAGRARAEAAVTTFYVLGLGLWASGLLLAGAIVAPVVFRHVPAPTSGDAMALVFRRIDSLSLGIAVFLVACEGTLATLRRELKRQDIVRMVMLALMVSGALALALYFTPHIAALHEAGIVRDGSPGGQQMESLHHGASRIGSCICILAVASAFAQVSRTRVRESS